MRTMVVNGESSVKVSPDSIEINLALESRNKDYAKAVELSNTNIKLLEGAAVKASIPPSELKTSAYNVTVENESVRDKDGNVKTVQKGYLVRQHMKVEIPLDFTLCGNFLSSVAESKANPQISLGFKIKDDTEIREKLMGEAMLKARKSALALAKISGVKLVNISEIRYNDSGVEPYSPLRVYNAPLACCASMEMTPEDVELKDSVMVVWEIE